MMSNSGYINCNFQLQCNANPRGLILTTDYNRVKNVFCGSSAQIPKCIIPCENYKNKHIAQWNDLTFKGKKTVLKILPCFAVLAHRQIVITGQ